MRQRSESFPSNQEAPTRSGPQLVMLAALGGFSMIWSLALSYAFFRLPAGTTFVLLLVVSALWSLWVSSATGWLRGLPAIHPADQPLRQEF